MAKQKEVVDPIMGGQEAGSLGFLAECCVECVLPVFCEVFERLDGLSPQASCDGQGSVPEGCKHLWRAPSTWLLTTLRDAAELG